MHVSSSLFAGLVAAALFCAAACSPSAPAALPVASAPAAATRVVSLAPAFTETLVALGAGSQVVGIGRFDPEVPGRADLPRLGDALDVNLESLLALEPDLVLVNSRVLAERLAPVAGKARVVELATDRLDDALAAVTRIARLTGRDAEGSALSAKIRTALDAATARHAGDARRPLVAVVVQHRPLYVAGGGSFVGDLLRYAGAENAFADTAQPWPQVSEEAVVARSPDVILDAAVGDVESAEGRLAVRREWDRFPTVRAVKDERVLVIREDALFRPGPRIPEALDVLERLIHGGKDAK